jgi:hypothetical protein
MAARCTVQQCSRTRPAGRRQEAAPPAPLLAPLLHVRCAPTVAAAMMAAAASSRAAPAQAGQMLLFLATVVWVVSPAAAPVPSDAALRGCSITELGCETDGGNGQGRRTLPYSACSGTLQLSKCFDVGRDWRFGAPSAGVPEPPRMPAPFEGPMTEELCAKACSLWLRGRGPTIHSGTQNGDQCWCSHFAYPYPGVPSSPSAECTVPCPGDATEMCGGPWVNTVTAVSCSQHTKWGWDFVLVVALGAAGYLGAGLALSHRQTGRAQIPHRRFWLGLSALVRDGVAFATDSVRNRSPDGAREQPSSARLVATADQLPGNYSASRTAAESPSSSSKGKSSGSRRKDKRRGMPRPSSPQDAPSRAAAASAGGEAEVPNKQPPPAATAAAGRWVRIPDG